MGLLTEARGGRRRRLARGGRLSRPATIAVSLEYDSGTSSIARRAPRRRRPVQDTASRPGARRRRVRCEVRRGPRPPGGPERRRPGGARRRGRGEPEQTHGGVPVGGPGDPEWSPVRRSDRSIRRPGVEVLFPCATACGKAARRRSACPPSTPRPGSGPPSSCATAVLGAGPQPPCGPAVLARAGAGARRSAGPAAVPAPAHAAARARLPVRGRRRGRSPRPRARSGAALVRGHPARHRPVGRPGARAAAAAGHRRLPSSRGLRLRDLESASLTAPDDDPAMGEIWDALIGPDDDDPAFRRAECASTSRGPGSVIKRHGRRRPGSPARGIARRPRTHARMNHSGCQYVHGRPQTPTVSCGQGEARDDVIRTRRRESTGVTGRGSFTHLHVHTEFSMLDGAARVGEVVGAAAADGQPAIGITDHGNMYGVLDFYKACRKQGIKPIIGTEAYMAHDSRLERPARRGRVDDSGGDAEGGSEALLPPDRCWPRTTSATGTSSSSPAAPTSRATTTSPASTGRLLAEHSEGVIATTGCLGGHVLQSLLQGDVRGRAREGRPAAGHLRARQPLRRDPGPRHPRAAPHQPAAARDRPAHRGARCSPPTTATTSTATTPSPTTRCCACRPARS